MHIVYVSDGKAGHRSQALGLYQAMQRQSAVDVTFQEIPLQELPLLDLFSALFSHQLDGITPTPTFIFGVGSHTHLRVWLLGKIFPTAKTVILMKPSLPIACFDYAVIPEHDGIPASDHVIVTKGALNPIVNEQRHIPNQILIALGGNSKRHQWNDQKVLQVLEKIIVNNPDAGLGRIYITLYIVKLAERYWYIHIPQSLLTGHTLVKCTAVISVCYPTPNSVVVEVGVPLKRAF